jgi:Bacterial PH domain
VTEQHRQWRVRQDRTVLKGIAAVGCAAAAVIFAGDRQFLVLAGIAAVVLAALTVRDLLIPVRLTAGPSGVTVVRGLAGHRDLPWAQIERIGLYESRRYGLRTRLLELDTGDALYLLSGNDLGAAPDEVADALRGIRAGT